MLPTMMTGALVCLLIVSTAFSFTPSVSFHKSYNTALLSSTPTTEVSDKRAVVVGGGPSGLAASLVLSSRHGYKVTVVEASDNVDRYDPTKAYPFLVNGRGQFLTKLFPESVHAKLQEKGIATDPTKNTMVVVPADPKEKFDPSKPKTLSMFSMEGKPEPNFWIKRHDFIRILLDAVNDDPNITLRTGTSCERIEKISENEICVVARDQSSSQEENFTAPLIVAADGMRSKVRTTLSEDSSPFRDWENGKPKGFRIKKRNSPAVGLNFKTLHINAKAKIPIGDGTECPLPFDAPINYALRSTFTQPNDAISLGMLPMKSGSSTRGVNVIRLPNHDIWKIKSVEEMRSWFSRAFPRLNWETVEGGEPMVTDDEWERFVNTRPLQLPPCQNCPELYCASPTGEGGIVLIGDAVHTFPPDLGEGVNSALHDVVELDKQLSESKSVAEAIKNYASIRGPESKALVRIVQNGAPFQYQQFGGWLTVQKFLWTANIAMRMLLNKVTFGLTPKPAFIQLVSDTNMKSSVAIRRADTLTAALTVFAGLLAIQVYRLVISM